MKRMSYPSISIFVLLVLGLDAGQARAETNCTNTSEGRICTITQPIISGALVPVSTQQALGLVSVAGGCSGTLLNRFWVLTADHCVSTDGEVGGPASLPIALPITAAWSERISIPTRVVRNWAPRLDIALIFLGGGDFGQANIQPFMVGDVEAGMTLTKYGIGIFAYASAGPPLAPSQPSDGYRSARFEVSVASTTGYRVSNTSGQIAAGGDSGGPDIVTGADGLGLGLAGVTSSCVYEGQPPIMPFMPPAQPSWMWVTRVDSCYSSAISPVRFEIIQIINEPCPDVSAGCAIMESAALLLLSN